MNEYHSSYYWLEDDPSVLPHSRIFWFGDLNYRLYLEDNLARQFIRKRDWRALQKFDQLQKELDDGGVFQGWREGDIEFAPTYKYSSTNCERYSGGLPSRVGEKQRTPAWYDNLSTWIFLKRVFFFFLSIHSKDMIQQEILRFMIRITETVYFLILRVCMPLHLVPIFTYETFCSYFFPLYRLF